MKLSLSPEFKDLLFSHHPDFPCFQNDVIVLFNRRICAGCLLGYPTAFLIILFVPLYGFWSIVLSLYFAALSQFRRVIPHNRLFGHYCRLLAGVAFGFGIGGLFWAITMREWLMAIILVIGSVFYFFSRLYSMKLKLEQYQKTNH